VPPRLRLAQQQTALSALRGQRGQLVLAGLLVEDIASRVLYLADGHRRQHRQEARRGAFDQERRPRNHRLRGRIPGCGRTISRRHGSGQDLLSRQRWTGLLEMQPSPWVLGNMTITPWLAYGYQPSGLPGRQNVTRAPMRSFTLRRVARVKELP